MPMLSLQDVFWTPEVNHLVVTCCCGAWFLWPTRISLMRCPGCKAQEWWHEGNWGRGFEVAECLIPAHQDQQDEDVGTGPVEEVN